MSEVEYRDYKVDYLVGSDGSVWSKNYHKTKGQLQQLKPQVIRGYLMVHLNPAGCGKEMWLVHRLVATVFHGQADGREVNHKDGNKHNNTPDNLEWTTRSGNMQHAHSSGIFARSEKWQVAVRLNKARKLAGRKLTPQKNTEISWLYHAGNIPQTTLAHQYGVSQMTISRAVNGDSHV